MTAKKPISNPENYLKDIRRKTRRIFTAEQKILIVMEALRAETSIAELCLSTLFRNLPSTNGTKNSLKRVKNNSREILFAKQPPKKSLSFGKRIASLKKRLPTLSSATTS